MKKLVWALVVVAIVSFIVWSKSPLDDTMNFIIGGSIPGTKTSLGFWPMMLVAGSILLLIRRGIKNAQFRMLESTAKSVKAEKIQAEFEQQNSSEINFDRRNRSVIAAPNSKPVF